MKIITNPDGSDIEQGSAAWYAAKLGVPSASNFHKIMTPETMELSRQWFPYACLLIAEKVLNQTLMDIGSLQWIERGKLLEPQAAAAYELENDVELRKVGFVITDDGEIGCSPDRMTVDLKAMLEIKCPAPQTHLRYFFGGFGNDYVLQAQGQCYVAETDWADRYSWCPGLPSVKQRTPRNEPYIRTLAARIDEFCDRRDALEERLLRTGCFETDNGRVVTPWEKYLRELEAREVAREPVDYVMAG